MTKRAHLADTLLAPNTPPDTMLDGESDALLSVLEECDAPCASRQPADGAADIVVVNLRVVWLASLAWNVEVSSCDTDNELEELCCCTAFTVVGAAWLEVEVWPSCDSCEEMDVGKDEDEETE